MPVNQSADYFLGGKAFMLVRSPQNGRAWERTGMPDLPTRRTAEDVRYGAVPDTIDHPEVWDDWSAGAFHAYRRPEDPESYAWSRGFDARFPRQLFHCQAPQVLPARYASINLNADYFLDVPLPGVANPPAGAGAVLAVGRGFIASYTPTQYQNTAGSAFDQVYEATGGGAINFGHRPAIFGSYTYIPNTDGSGFYQRGHDGTTYTLSAQPARWFKSAAGRMWFAFSRNQLRSVAIGVDPMLTANYSATLPLGNGFLTSDDAEAIENQLYVGFPDGAYQGNLSGTFNNVLGDLGEIVDVDSCRDLAAYENGLIAAQGRHVWWYKPSTATSILQEVGPTTVQRVNNSPIRGKITCLEANGRWLYAGLFTGSLSYFLAARNASPGLPYVWHTLHDFLGLTCKVTRLHLDGITTTSGGAQIPQRIWAATDATFGAGAGATAPIFWWPVPRGDDSPLLDTTFSPNYMGSARMDFGASDWEAPTTPKVFREVEVWADSMLSGAQYANIYYTLDTRARSQMGLAAVSPKSAIFFPSTSPFVAGQNMITSIESFTASASVTPTYRALVVRGTARPASLDEVRAKTRVADNLPDRTGAIMRDGATQIAELRSFAGNGSPQQLIDIAGATSWAVVIPPVVETELWQEGEIAPEMQAEVHMAVLVFTGPVPPCVGCEDNLALNTETVLTAYSENQLMFLP